MSLHCHRILKDPTSSFSKHLFPRGRPCLQPGDGEIGQAIQQAHIATGARRGGHLPKLGQATAIVPATALAVPSIHKSLEDCSTIQKESRVSSPTTINTVIIWHPNAKPKVLSQQASDLFELKLTIPEPRNDAKFKVTLHNCFCLDPSMQAKQQIDGFKTLLVAHNSCSRQKIPSSRCWCLLCIIAPGPGFCCTQSLEFGIGQISSIDIAPLWVKILRLQAAFQPASTNTSVYDLFSLVFHVVGPPKWGQVSPWAEAQ